LLRLIESALAERVHEREAQRVWVSPM